MRTKELGGKREELAHAAAAEIPMAARCLGKCRARASRLSSLTLFNREERQLRAELFSERNYHNAYIQPPRGLNLHAPLLDRQHTYRDHWHTAFKLFAHHASFSHTEIFTQHTDRGLLEDIETNNVFSGAPFICWGAPCNVITASAMIG